MNKKEIENNSNIIFGNLSKIYHNIDIINKKMMEQKNKKIEEEKKKIIEKEKTIKIIEEKNKINNQKPINNQEDNKGMNNRIIKNNQREINNNDNVTNKGQRRDNIDNNVDYQYKNEEFNQYNYNNKDNNLYLNKGKSTPDNNINKEKNNLPYNKNIGLLSQDKINLNRNSYKIQIKKDKNPDYYQARIKKEPKEEIHINNNNNQNKPNNNFEKKNSGNIQPKTYIKRVDQKNIFYLLLEEIFFNNLNDLSKEEEEKVFDCYFKLKNNKFDPINELNNFYHENIYKYSKEINNYENRKSIISLKFNKIKSYFVQLNKPDNPNNYNVNNFNSSNYQYNNPNERLYNQGRPNTNIYPNNIRKKYNINNNSYY